MKTSSVADLRRLLRPSTLLEAALLVTIAAHLAAMLGMALLLIPGMPGGTSSTLAARAAYVGAHPWVWRVGWLGWQTTAASDLLLAIALLRTSWIPRLPALVALVCTLAGILPDQINQWRWTWPGVVLAQSAVRTHDFAAYGSFETHALRQIAGWGTVGYLSAALAWTWCFAAAGAWSRTLTWLSIVTWSLFAAATCPLFFYATPGAEPKWLEVVTSAGNAIAFVLLIAWLLGVLYAVVHRPSSTFPAASRGSATA